MTSMTEDEYLSVEELAEPDRFRGFGEAEWDLHAGAIQRERDELRGELDLAQSIRRAEELRIDELRAEVVRLTEENRKLKEQLAGGKPVARKDMPMTSETPQSATASDIAAHATENVGTTENYIRQLEAENEQLRDSSNRLRAMYKGAADGWLEEERETERLRAALEMIATASNWHPDDMQALARTALTKHR